MRSITGVEAPIALEDVSTCLGPSGAGHWVRAVATGAGRPIVLVHGLGLSCKSWLHNLGPLGAAGRVHAVDLPGFGRSENPRTVWSPERQAAALAEWCLALGVGRATFVGHSLGAEVCLWLAARHPQHVGGLVLAGPTGGTPCPRLLPRLGRLLLDAWREPPHFMPVLLKAYAQAGPYRMIETIRRTDPTRLAPHLRSIQAPALVVWGAQDPVVTLAEALSLVRGLPNARLLAINDAAHGLPFDAPERFNRAVLEFHAATASPCCGDAAL